LSGPDLQTLWATFLIDSLAQAGVRHAVLSPGSRSTPLALAVTNHEQIEVATILDERSAAFFALGEAKVTGRPTLLICTSGTAGAHYYPAVIEASQSYAPMIVITADRPPELHGNAGSQTTNQIRLFGEHARRYFELGLPDAHPDGIRALRRKAQQAYLASLSPTPGAVHLNAWFRKPLEPHDGGDLVDTFDAVGAEPFSVPYPPDSLPDEGGIADAADTCRRSRRGLIVCGPSPLDQIHARAAIAELSETLRYPVLAEGASQIRFTGQPRPLRCDGFDTFLRARPFLERMRPEVILQFGAPPTSKGWEHFAAAHRQARRYVFAPHGWNDPQNVAAGLIMATPERAASALREALLGLGDRRPTPWTEEFGAADARVWRTVERHAKTDGATLTKIALARAVVSAAPPGSILAVGNSLAIREVDNFCPGAVADLRVWSQKGANGIDGLISGAGGAARVDGGPVTLYLGDLAFLHDLSGLAAVRNLEVPFVIVVAQNNGGRIFEQLPVASCPGVDADRLGNWTTPHGLDFSLAAYLFRVPHRKVECAAELVDAIREAHARSGCTVIEAVVPPSAAAEEHRRLVDEVEDALAGDGA